MTETKKFGIWTLIFLVIANMVGAGVFTTSGFTLQSLGTPSWVIAAWVAGGILALAGAAAYGELARVMPESGGEYLFLSRAAHPMLGFIAGWVSLIAGFSGAIAFAATALESYLLPERVRPDWLPADTLAVASIVVAGGLHGIRASFGATFQNVVVALKLGLLAVLVAIAAIKLPTYSWFTTGLPDVDLTTWQLIAAFANSLIWISLSYLGFNAAVYIAGESVDAGRNVPRALLIGTTIVIVLYLALNAIFVYAPEPQSIAGVPDVAAVAAQALGGAALAVFVRIMICAALLTSVFSMVMAAPRVYAKMAHDGLLPGFMRLQGDAPRVAVLVQVLIASALAIFYSSLKDLLFYLGLTLSLSAACTVACLFLPHVRTKPLWHPVHFAAMLYIVGTFTTATLLTINQPVQLLGTVVTVVTGVCAYQITRYFSRVPAKAV